MQITIHRVFLSRPPRDNPNENSNDKAWPQPNIARSGKRRRFKKYTGEKVLIPLSPWWREGQREGEDCVPVRQNQRLPRLMIFAEQTSTRVKKVIEPSHPALSRKVRGWFFFKPPTKPGVDIWELLFPFFFRLFGREFFGSFHLFEPSVFARQVPPDYVFWILVPVVEDVEKLFDEFLKFRHGS